ncbi:MAG TPA: aminotransferase class V-fold PLP-dependent enzyme [Polyangia bacterium]|jgi:cysteine desulfurase|nr:aminotransferase class V-fold PLP-dependent enzyme [Polyangia bacterium]
MAPTPVYLDNAASTRPADEVVRAMAEASARWYANPSSAHAEGAAAARALEEARAAVLAALGTDTGQLIFTGGGTEANALGMLGAAALARGRHVVASAIEHAAVLRNAEKLAMERGFELSTPLPDIATGVVAVADVVARLRRDTAVVALMLVNNEVGTLQPVAELARALGTFAAREGIRRPHLHVDAVQAFGQLPLRAAALGADSIALSAHKLHGPKGVGALWLRPNARVAALWDGGRQERGLRSGTENLPAIVGFGQAAALAGAALRSGAPDRIAALRDALEAGIRAAVPRARPTVTGGPRAPHIASVCFPKLPAEPLLHALEARAVFVSAGSACASRTRGPSHVLKAVGVDDDTAVLRFSLSRHTTAADVDAAVAALTAAVQEVAA